MSTIAVNIRWATNTAELKRNIAEGIDTIDAMKTSVKSLADSLSGQGLYAAANKAVLAIQQLGGAEKLTGDEAARMAAQIEKAIEKAEAAGRRIPSAWRDQVAELKQVGGQWQQFVGNFNLEAAIKNPAAAAKEGILAFTDTLGPAAVAGAATAGVVAAIGVELFKLTDAAAKSGAELGDMADKTGMSVEKLSQFKNAAGVLDTDLNTLTGATVEIERRIGEGTDKFKHALEGIGLSIDVLKQAGPDQYLELVAQGLAGVADQDTRNALGNEILGKSYKNLSATLADLPKALQMVADITPWTKEQADDAERFEMQLKNLEIHAKAFAENLGRELIPKLINTAEWFQKNSGYAEAWRISMAGLDVLTGHTPEAPKITGGGEQAGHNPQLEVLAQQAKFAAPMVSAPGSKASLDAAFAQQTTAIRILKGDYKELSAEQRKAQHEAEKTAEAFQHIADASVDYDTAIDKVGRATYETIVALHAAGVSVDELSRAYRLSKGDVEVLLKANEQERTLLKLRNEIEKTLNKESEDEAKRHQAEIAKGIIALATIDAEMREKQRAQQGETPQAKTTREWQNKLAELEAAAKEAGPGMEAAFKAEADRINTVFSQELASEDMADAMRAAGEQDSGFFSSGFAIIGGELPDLITQALTGGGGLEGAFKALGHKEGDFFADSFLHSKIGEGFADKLGGMFKIKPSALGGFISGLSGIMSAGIGTAINFGIGLLGKGLKKLFGGPSQAELEGRKKVADFEAQIAAAASSTQKAEAGTESWKLTVITVRDAYLKAGKSAAEAEAAVKRLWESSKKGAEEQAAAIKDINDVLQDQKQDEEDLKAAIQRYGFSIEQLGPQMKKQQLDEQAKQLMNDWRLLVGSGISIVTVNEKMAKSVNEYLQTAKKTGVEVPAAMRPILESMVKQGQLTDENGNKLNDLNGIKFGETMTEGFDRVVDRLDKLLQGLGMIPPALDRIPNRKDIDVVTHYRHDGDSGDTGDGGRGRGGYTGGVVTAVGIQHFALGGPVRPAFGYAFGRPPNSVDRVPAWLQPGEWLFNAGQQQGLMSMLNAGATMARELTRPPTTTAAGAGAPVIHLEPHVTIQALDGISVQRVVESGAFTSAMLETLRRDTGGLYTAVVNIARTTT